MLEAAAQNWCSLALDRQIGTLYYERLVLSKDKAVVQDEAAHIELDLYPKIEAMSTQDKAGNKQDGNSRNKDKVARETMSLFDFDRIYLAVQEFKQLRSWSNLRLERSRLVDFCLTRDDWYTLYIPQAELAIRSIAGIRKQEDIFIRLLQDYTGRFYKALKTAYEGQFYSIVNVKKDDDICSRSITLRSTTTKTGKLTRRK
jgi:hypothetical protein